MSAQREWEGRSWFPPGPQLAICLSGSDKGLSGLSEAELLEVAAAARRQTSWAQARELAAIAELTRRRTQEENEQPHDYRVISAWESVTEEVAAALKVTGNAAGTLVHLADRLAHELPGTREYLETGRIDLSKARVICDLTDRLGDGLPAEVEARVLESAPEQTTGQLRRRVKRVVERLAPSERQERTREAVADRRVELWENSSGTASLFLLDLDPVHAHGIYNKLTAVARGLKADGDTRRQHQICADLATTLLCGADPSSLSLADAARIQLSEDGSSASPESERPSEDADQSAEAAHQQSMDQQAATVARIIDRRLGQVLQHARDTGRLSDLHSAISQAVDDLRDHLADRHPCLAANGETHGHTGYRPPAALRKLIEERHTTCAYPSCNQPSRRCDLDHTIAWRPGVTCHCNLAPLCRRHHRAKQTPGWKLVQPWPGVLVWITPAGNWHITLPDRS